MNEDQKAESGNRKEGSPAHGAERSPLRSPISDFRSLEAEADRIAALRADPRTPAVVRRAFLRPGGLTLRKLLALEDAASPVLDGRWPADDAAAMARAFCTAWEILFPGRDVPPAAELARSIDEMHDEVIRGFSTVMPMRFPRVGSDGASPSQDGLGWVARFVARFPFPPDTTLDMPLDQLFILAAAQSANEGADCAGEDYREREVGNLKAETGDMKEGSAAGGLPLVPRGIHGVGPEKCDPEEEKEKKADDEEKSHEGNVA